MEAPGGRPDIAPYPDWTARFLVHQAADQRAFMLANADLAGSFSAHYREPEDGPYRGLGADRLISIQERPSFWADPRGHAGQRPVTVSESALLPNDAHAPSLDYVPYLVTGDRYYADELKFWANFHLLNNWGSASDSRGADGLIVGNAQARALAWSLRDITDAAAYLPDADPAKAYFARAVQSNLAWLDRHAQDNAGPLGIAWFGPQGRGHAIKDPAGAHWWVQPWQQNFLAWAVDHANRQGFAGGTTYRDQVARFQLALFTSPQYPREYAGPDAIAVGDWVTGANGQLVFRPYTPWRRCSRPATGRPTRRRPSTATTGWMPTSRSRSPSATAGTGPTTRCGGSTPRSRIT